MRDMIRMAYSAPRMTADDTAEMRLYGEIITDMPENWKYSKEDKSSADFKKAIDEIRGRGATKLNLRINSPGGVVHESVAMRSILAGAGFEEINMKIEGLCASAATVIATLPGAHVSMAPGSEYMIHNPWTITWGNANDIEKEVAHLRSMEESIRSLYTMRTGREEQEIKNWMDEETWFTAEQAKEYGFVDEISEEKSAPAAACVTRNMMSTMKALYAKVPEEITEFDAEAEVAAARSAEHKNSNKETEEHMEIKDITMEQLMAENRAVYDQIINAGIENERQRMLDIETLTDEGYEEMANEAKAQGTSAADFMRNMIAEKKAKAKGYIAARTKETAPAKQVDAGAAEDDAMMAEKKNEVKAEADREDTAKALAEAAQNVTVSGGMF